MKVRDLLISGKFGDGYLVDNKNRIKKTAYIGYTSKNLDYIQYKRDFLMSNTNYYLSKIGTCNSGYKKGNFSYIFRTGCYENIYKCKKMSIETALNYLTKDSLILFYLDDGTYHQKKHFSHIYCNTFSKNSCDILINKIYELYPIKKCIIAQDKKSDGRSYPYIRLNTFTTKEFIKDVEEFLLKNEIFSLMYKVGKNLPSTTIESTILRAEDIKIRKRVE